jgi:hypothetical protein
VLWPLEHVGGGADLDHAAQVHDRDAVAEGPGEADVVRDQEQRQPARPAQAEQQVQHLGAHGDVERRDGLVTYEPGGLRRERAGDRDALPLTARELVRVTLPEALCGPQAGVLQRGRGAQHALGPGHPLHAQRLLHQVAHAHARIERLIGILEHHLHPAPHRAHAAAVERRALEAQLAAGRLLEPEQRACERRLAAAGLADDAEHLVLAPLEVDAVQGLHGASPPAERDFEPTGLREWRDRTCQWGGAHRTPPPTAVC